MGRLGVCHALLSDLTAACMDVSNSWRFTIARVFLCAHYPPEGTDPRWRGLRAAGSNLRTGSPTAVTSTLPSISTMSAR